MPLIKDRDWKALRNREELFFRYFKWRVSVHDLDHGHYCKTLTEDMTDQQKCWFSFLFGMTYRTPQAYAYWWTFNNLDDINLNELKKWNADNWKRTTYGTDARYNKGHFYDQVKSIMDWKGKYSLHGKIKSLISDNDPRENFESLFEGICEVHKYGRMTAWITCQCLYDTLSLNIDFDNVFIRSPASDSGMQSIWNGYCVMKGYGHMLLGKYAETNYKVTETDLEVVSKDIMRYRDKAQEYAGHSVDVFKWESIWCQFKRLFNKEKTREYPGHSSGDAASRYTYYREFWPEVNWYKFRKALLSQPGIIRGQTYRNDYNYIFGETGLLLNIHEMYQDMPNAYQKLELDPNENIVKELFTDHGYAVPVIKF